MQKAYEDGIVVQTKPGAVPRQKRYLDEQKGAPLGSVWSDIKPVQSQAIERTGYPTQKPVKLLDRIIEASSNEGDIVFDPFCGCATTLVAADRLERQWAGIDLSPLAVKLVNERISEDRGALWGGANVVDSLPKRTDLGELPNYRTHRHRLYGEQEGVCLGCDTHFPFKVMEVDHILPKSRGGTDHFENLQLLMHALQQEQGQQDDGGVAGGAVRLAHLFHILAAAIHTGEHGRQVDAFVEVIPIDVETEHFVVLPLRVGGVLQARIKFQRKANHATIRECNPRVFLGE